MFFCGGGWRRGWMRRAIPGWYRLGEGVPNRLPVGDTHHQCHGVVPHRRFHYAVRNEVDLPQSVRIFPTTGLCGGYTTFSTFSLDSYYLIGRGQTVAAAAYMIGSVILSVGALVAAATVLQARSLSPISAIALATSAFAESANSTIGRRVRGDMKPSRHRAYFRAAGLSLAREAVSRASRFCKDLAVCNRPCLQLEKI